MAIQNSIVTNSSDYLYRTTNLLNHNSNWSASLWFYPTSFSNYAHIFMATAASSPGAGDYINSDFIGHNNANPALLRAMASYSGNSAATGATLALNTWHFVGITRESATVLKAYINGNTTASISITKDITGRGATALQVLGTGNATYPLLGRIACVKEWDATLTGAEFSDEMNKSYAVRTSNLREVFNFVTGANIFVGSENGYTWTEAGAVGEATGPDLDEAATPKSFPPYDVRYRINKLLRF